VTWNASIKSLLAYFLNWLEQTVRLTTNRDEARENLTHLRE